MHPFVITFVVNQLAISLILLYAAWKGGYAIRFWSAVSHSALQLRLEQEHYLLGAVVQVAMGAQLAGLALFVWLINNYLPSLIRGAMCGTGTLQANVYGYPLLYLKMCMPLLSTFYLLLQYLENCQPGYRLTPLKYYFLIPIAVVAMAETGLTVAYFANISPNVIVTCCSLNFISDSLQHIGLLSRQEILQPAIGIWIALGFALMAFHWNKRHLPTWLNALLVGIYTGLSVFTLKYFFVKYIYGLPSHLCLFDLFLPHYHYIGYGLFAIYYALIISAMVPLTAGIFSTKVKAKESFLQGWSRLQFMALLLSLFLPLAYYFSWTGGTL